MRFGRDLLRGLRSTGCGLTCAIALVLGSPAGADDWDDDEGLFAETGSYLSLGWTYAVEDIDSPIGDTDAGKGIQQVSHSSDAQGVNVIFGQRALEWFSVEVEYEFVDGFEIEDSDAAVEFDLDIHTVTMNAKVFPLHGLLNQVNEGRLQPHMVLGFGMMATKDFGIDAARAIVLRMGGGLDYFINPKWSVFGKASYVLPFGNLDGLRYVSTSLGVRYHLD